MTISIREQREAVKLYALSCAANGLPKAAEVFEAAALTLGKVERGELVPSQVRIVDSLWGKP